MSMSSANKTADLSGGIDGKFARLSDAVVPRDSNPFRAFTPAKSLGAVNTTGFASQRMASIDNLTRTVKPMMQASKTLGIPKTGCMPGCTLDHHHTFDYDYTKNFKNPEAQRPGEFKGIDWDKVNATLGKSGDCAWGKKQTPINLDTNIEILQDFQDKDFKFDYEEIVPRG